MRGYYGIGIEGTKTPANVGGLWRSAQAFGASFVFTVGARYPQRFQPTDTTKALRHVPLWEYDDADEFFTRLPRDCVVVGVENDHSERTPRPLPSFHHPERAVYLLGAEDRGLSQDTQARCRSLVEIPTCYCLNVATAGSIVLYDRAVKERA